MLLARLQAQQAAWDRHLNRTEAFFGLSLAALAAHAGVLASRPEDRPGVAIVLLFVNIGLFLIVAAFAAITHWRTSLGSPPEPENVYWVIGDDSRFEDWADAIHKCIVSNRPRVKAKAENGTRCFNALGVQTLVAVAGIAFIGHQGQHARNFRTS